MGQHDHTVHEIVFKNSQVYFRVLITTSISVTPIIQIHLIGDHCELKYSVSN